MELVNLQSAKETKTTVIKKKREKAFDKGNGKCKRSSKT